MNTQSNRVFLSYAKEDAGLVHRVYARLQKDGFSVWLDAYDLLPGHDWDAAIRGAIRQSGAFLVFLTEQATTKQGYLQKEIREALEVAELVPEGRVFIIPVRLGDVQVPERLRKWQWVDLFKRGGYRRLKEALAKEVGLTPARRLASRHLQWDTPIDQLIYELCTESGRMLYCRIDTKFVAISQGNFLIVHRGSIAPFKRIKNEISDFRRLPLGALRNVLPSKTMRGHGHPVTRMTLNQKEGAVVFSAERMRCAINTRYWSLALLCCPNPEVFVTGRLAPVYVEQDGMTRAVIMPLRM